MIAPADPWGASYPRDCLELTFNAAGWAYLRTLPPGRYALHIGSPEGGPVWGRYTLHWTGHSYWVEVPRPPWDARLIPVPPAP